MRYREKRDQSAELLRLALAEMGRHTAAFTPATFAIWYEHLAGINPPLSAAIATQLQTQASFDDATVDRLYMAHVAELDATKAEKISDRFQRLMNGMSEAASHTGETAGQFGDKLTALSASLKNEDAGQIISGLEDALRDTLQMQASVEALKAQVAKSQKEIDALRSDLERERTDALMCPLSRVLNRRGFDLNIDAMLKNPAPVGHRHVLLMLDLDHFKKVNDTHGHLIGDRVIQALGEVLRVSVDMPGASSARYGGEEFAVLMPATTASEALKLAELLRGRVKAMKIRNRTTNEVVLTVTVSGGIAMATANEDAPSLIARADAALYQSKQTGRDRVTAV